jgi:hypothetical protein
MENQRAIRGDLPTGDISRNDDANGAIHTHQGVIGAIDKSELRDTPIRPAWILEGTPKARTKILSEGSTDGTAFMVMWDCTAGRFNWFYDVDETVYILEGSVALTLPSGATHRLVAGSTYYFAHGTQAQWRVDQYIRKVAFCHAPMSAKLRLAKRMFSTLKRLGRPGSPAEDRSKMFESP